MLYFLSRVDPFEYELVAVVANDAHINSVNDLRGSRLCHPGYGLNTGTNILSNVNYKYVDLMRAIKNLNYSIKFLICLVNRLYYLTSKWKSILLSFTYFLSIRLMWNFKKRRILMKILGFFVARFSWQYFK